MTCDVISCSRSADYPRQWVFRGIDLTGFSPEFAIADAEGGTNRLNVSNIATANGSIIAVSSASETSSVVTLLLKENDIAALPANPWDGVWQFRILAPTSVTTEIQSGTIEARGGV